MNEWRRPDDPPPADRTTLVAVITEFFGVNEILAGFYGPRDSAIMEHDGRDVAIPDYLGFYFVPDGTDAAYAEIGVVAWCELPPIPEWAKNAR